MNDQNFPGFAEDDAPKPKKPAPVPSSTPAAKPPSPAPSYEFAEDDAPAAPPSKPAGKAPAPAAFNPFGDQAVKIPVGGSAVGGAPSGPPAGGAPALDPSEADVTPGMAKDLWLCPHCGAKNKPSRTTCRECSKSPDDEVIVPWQKKPAVLGAIGGGAILIIVVLMLAFRSDVSFRVPGPGRIDDKVRLGGGGGGEQDLGGGHRFTARGTLSVSGRILLSTQHPSSSWLYVVVLGLGRNVLNDDDFKSSKVEMKENDYSVSGSTKAVMLFLIVDPTEKPALAKGDYLSVMGERGLVEEDGIVVPGTNPSDYSDRYVVKVKRIAEE